MSREIARRLRPALVRRLARLDLRARVLVDGFFAGSHRSPRRGFSVEFSDYREFVPGDSPQDIDWRVYARTDKFYVKQYQAETSVRAMLVLDGSASMAYGSPAAAEGRAKLDYAVLLAAALGYLLLRRQHDRVGLVTVGGAFAEESSGPRRPPPAFADWGRGPLTRFLPPRSKRSHLERLLRLMAALRPAGAAALPEGLKRLLQLERRRGMVVAFSDLLCDTAALGVALAHLRATGREVILFQVLDPAELSPPDFSGLLVRDPETRQLFAPRRRFLTGEYARCLRAHQETLAALCLRHRADLVTLTTNSPFEVGLLSFLEARKRRG